MDTFIYIFGAIFTILYIPVFYQVYMLRKDIKSLKKKTEKLVDWWYNIYRYATVAQRIEQMPSKHLATGSSPVGCILNPIPKKMGFFY